MSMCLCVDCDLLFDNDGYCPSCRKCTSCTSIYDLDGTVAGAIRKFAATFGMKRVLRLDYWADGRRNQVKLLDVSFIVSSGAS